ncbi:MAG TPA: hypothetical protein VNT50_03190 [Microbacterium sp.]|uniref:hypothetical protein n=1 Tax=Microbacterium sp. TaxID=51671 RepID=UPI002B8BB64F|nr:hypothetical protein [Microbacterium sp.]HWI30468.1 hypothetical protein [Microbacterium sp.]
MAGLWGKRKREELEALQAQDADLARRAKSALVAVDERLRTTDDELAFAVAELGEGPTRDLKEALTAVKHHLGEAFHLNQLNHDHIPDTPEELRTRNARIVQLCEWADELLDDRTTSLAKDIERVRRAPEILAQVKAETVQLGERLPHARATIERLSARYSEEALRQVSAGADEAEQLLAFAAHSADVSTRRREAGRAEEANLALETSTEAVRRAAAIIDGVEDFEIEALRAESTLADVVADSRGDLVAAREAPQVPAVAAAVKALQAALAALPAPGTKSDPFAELSQLRDANSGLDAAIAAARDRLARPIPSVHHVRHALDDADRQIAVARNVIAGHRGWIGADARTRLAEAERARIDAEPLASDEDTRENAMALARRAGALASESLQLAQRDIDSSRPQGGNWGGPTQGGRGGMSDAMGGILGGVVIGSLLGDFFG